VLLRLINFNYDKILVDSTSTNPVKGLKHFQFSPLKNKIVRSNDSDTSKANRGSWIRVPLFNHRLNIVQLDRTMVSKTRFQIFSHIKKLINMGSNVSVTSSAKRAVIGSSPILNENSINSVGRALNFTYKFSPIFKYLRAVIEVFLRHLEPRKYRFKTYLPHQYPQITHNGEVAQLVEAVKKRLLNFLPFNINIGVVN
jgi:hypothetical protein